MAMYFDDYFMFCRYLLERDPDPNASIMEWVRVCHQVRCKMPTLEDVIRGPYSRVWFIWPLDQPVTAVPMYDAVKWCERNVKRDDWFNNSLFFFFTHDADAIAFKLAFSQYAIFSRLGKEHDASKTVEDAIH